MEKKNQSVEKRGVQQGARAGESTKQQTPRKTASPKVEQEVNALLAKACEVRHYLQGFRYQMAESLRELPDEQQLLVARVFRACDRKGQDFVKRPPSIYAPLLPEMGVQ